MSKVDDYRRTLEALADWDPYLLEHSGLPGPRGNIELGRAAAGVAASSQIAGWLEWDSVKAPTNSPEEFLAFCGVLALGHSAARGNEEAFVALRGHASDQRWRTREAVAMAVQHVAAQDFDRAASAMTAWANGGWLEQRAAVAGLCEPALLTTPQRVEAVLDLLDVATAAICDAQVEDRRAPEFRALRKGLGYCWSVAVAADTGLGIVRMERWIVVDDRDIRWVMKTNLSKKRLDRLAGPWTQAQRKLLDRR